MESRRSEKDPRADDPACLLLISCYVNKRRERHASFYCRNIRSHEQVAKVSWSSTSGMKCPRCEKAMEPVDHGFKCEPCLKPHCSERFSIGGSFLQEAVTVRERRHQCTVSRGASETAAPSPL